MPTVRERILDYLRRHPEGATASELTAALQIRYHAQVNDRCRQLASDGLIDRRRVDGTLRNFWQGSAASAPSAEPAAESEPSPDEPWFWEGNVQSAVVAFLKQRGYSVIRTANTKSRQPGKDIEARGPSGAVWVTVKGWPKGTTRTKPSTQSGHWFKHAFFDLIVWRGEDRDAKLLVALPDYERYRTLAQRVSWLQSIARFGYLWVKQDGSISVQGSEL